MLEVTAGIICSPQGRILVAQRKLTDQFIPNFWEFPGGKLDQHETLENCLVREIYEEFELPIQILSPFMSIEHTYPGLNLRLHSFLANCESEKVNCKQHQNYMWIKKEKAQSFDFAPADIPILEKLLITSWP